MAALQADKQRLARESTQMARALREAVQARKQAQAEVAAARAALQQAQAVAWGTGIQIGEPSCCSTHRSAWSDGTQVGKPGF